MTAWILALMVYLCPPERLAALPAYPGWGETPTEVQQRYEAIAASIAAVVEDPAEVPAVGGPRGRYQTAALLVAVAWKESGFAADVDVGPCHQPKSTSPRCDGGKAVSLWQIRVGAGATPEGWTRSDLEGDRGKAAQVAHQRIRRSAAACRRQGRLAALRAYASGSCERGHEASAVRVRLALRLLDAVPIPTF